MAIKLLGNMGDTKNLGRNKGAMKLIILGSCPLCLPEIRRIVPCDIMGYLLTAIDTATVPPKPLKIVAIAAENHSERSDRLGFFGS